jgi:hypothetical protein
VGSARRSATSAGRFYTVERFSSWWRELYNFFRLHGSLKDKTPEEFAPGTDYASLRQPLGLERKLALLH